MSDLFDRFPDMKPIQGPPTLSTINGIGTTAYGGRDLDPDTGTYVKTVWFTVLYIPVIPVAAFRVADADGGGWYFLGRVPLSRSAKTWPLILLLITSGAIGFFWWKSYTETPSYQAGKQLAEADRLRQQGKLADAANQYREIADGPTDKSGEAVQAITAMLDSPDLLSHGDPAQMAVVFRVAYSLRGKPGAVPDLFQRGQRFAEARTEDSPDGSLAVLDAVEPAAPSPDASRPLRQKILEQLVKAHPDDMELLSKLAVIYEQARLNERCLELLEPHLTKLGTTEGARVLGLLYFEQGQHDKAFTLLEPYAEKGLKVLRDAEQKYSTLHDNAYKKVLEELKTGKVVDFDYVQYDASSDQEKPGIVDDYVMKRLKNDEALTAARDELMRRAVVVPVALDLGLISLGRAQHPGEASNRKAELERAEKMFKAVRNLAGEEAEMSLAQVDYWLGREAEGKKRFDAILRINNRQFKTLLEVANRLRDLGAMAEARTLMEEAYARMDANATERMLAAEMRAITQKDLDDQILWLDRADRTKPQVKASLAEARGQKAEREGKDAEAATFYREAVAVYAEQPENASTLNNGGLACLNLYRVTGDPTVLDKGVRMQEKALALSPGDGILASNVAHSLLGAALSEVIGDRVELRKLRRPGGLGDLSYLYRDAASREALIRKIKESAAVAKARTQLDRALILSPKNTGLYAINEILLWYLSDIDGLSALDQRAAESHIDLTEAKQELRDELAGKNDEKNRRDGATAVERAEKTLTEARKAGGATMAIAASSVVRARLAQAQLGMAFDADELVRLAEEADKQAPSVGTRSTLQSALIARANRDLSAHDQEYAALAKKAGRSLANGEVIAIALWREGKLRDQTAANADVRRTIELVRSDYALLTDPSEWQWAMLRAGHPDIATRVAAALKVNELLPVQRALESRLSAPNASAVLRQCWALEAAGKSTEAKDLLKRSKADGLALPFELP